MVGVKGMNKIYRLVFSKRTGKVVVVSEATRSSTKGAAGEASGLVSLLAPLSKVAVAVSLALAGWGGGVGRYAKRDRRSGCGGRHFHIGW